MMDKKGAATFVLGRPAVLAPLGTFEKWTGRPKGPKDFFGIVRVGGAAVIVFNDPEPSFVLPQRDGTVLIVQTILNRPKLAAHLKKLPTDGWRRATGVYESDGSVHVLWDGMYTKDELADEGLVEDMDLSPPIRVAIPAGAYALEVYGTWKPDKQTEYSLGRLVPRR